MGFFSWLKPAPRQTAVQLIENALGNLKLAGMFDPDPAQSAKEVSAYALSKLPSGGRDISPHVAAATWLAVYAIETRSSRESRLPFANTALALLDETKHLGETMTTVDRNLASYTLDELTNKFFNAPTCPAVEPEPQPQAEPEVNPDDPYGLWAGAPEVWPTPMVGEQLIRVSKNNFIAIKKDR